MAKLQLGQWSFVDGYASSVPRIVLHNILAWGTVNAILTGLGFARNFGGLDKLTGDGSLGSTQFFQTDNTFAGLGDEDTYGQGSIFKAQNVLTVVGEGPIRIAGEDLGIDADSTLQYLRKESGEWVNTLYPAGQARPTSQTIFPTTTPGTGKPAMDGAVCTVIWRVDSVTGQPSLASLPSNVISLSGQTVIQPFPLTDDAQDYWGIGVCKPGFGTIPVFYELKTDLGGEVAESTLAYTREVEGASIADTTNVVDITDADVADQFVAADVGRRIAFGTFDSWITEVVSATQVKVFDENTSGGTISGDATVTHATEGILRSVEISWTAESLQGQQLAPNDAYPPDSNLKHAGIINDTTFIETADGVIYVGVPGFLGSYPPKRTLFPPEPAVVYLDGSDGLFWRWSKNMLQVLAYTGGDYPIQLQTVWKNVGILFPQNAAVGIGGRAIAWSGKPVRLGAGGEPDVAFAYKVYKDFEGWNEQTAERPVIATADPENQFDIWAYDDKIMACRAGTDIWCSPIDVSGYLAEGENLISAVIVDNKLRFATNAGTELFMYHFDEGGGSTMIIQTPEHISSGQSDTITQVDAIVHIDDTDSIDISIIKDFDDGTPIVVESFEPASSPANQHLKARTNIICAKEHSVKIEIESDGKDVGVQLVTTYGETNDIFIS